MWVLYCASSGLYPRQNQLQTSRKQWNGQKLLIQLISFDCPSSSPLSQSEEVLCPLQFYWVWGEYLSRKLQLLLWPRNVSVIVWIFEYSFKKVLAHFPIYVAIFWRKFNKGRWWWSESWQFKFWTIFLRSKILTLTNIIIMTRFVGITINSLIRDKICLAVKC